MSRGESGVRRLLPADRGRANRLTFDDLLFLTVRDVLQIPLVNQVVWRFDHTVPPSEVQALHAHLGSGPFGRLAVRSPVPGARPRWVRGITVALLTDAPITPSEVTTWIAAQARRELDPVRGPGWLLSTVDTTEGETLVSLLTCHEIVDGGAVLGSTRAAVERRNLPVTPAALHEVRRRDDLRDALHLVRLAWHGLRTARRSATSTGAPPPPAPTPTRSSPRPGGPTPLGGATAILRTDPTQWSDVARRHGGTSNSLLVALTAELLVEAGRVRPGATVRVGLPVDTRGQDDHRSNATTGVSIQVPVGDPDSGPAVDLAEVRRLSREAFVAVSEGRRSDPTEPLRPLLQLLPAALTRRVAARSSAPLCLASNLGRLPATFGAPFGTEASAVVMRSVTQGADADALRERGGGISSWWSEVSGSTTLSLAGLDPDAWPDDATLLRDAVTVLGRWGIDAQPW